MLRLRWAIALAAIAVLAACGKGPGAGASTAQPASETAPVLLLAPEDLRTVAIGGAGGMTGGQVITGSMQPERRADLRPRCRLW